METNLKDFGKFLYKLAVMLFLHNLTIFYTCINNFDSFFHIFYEV